MKRRDIVIAIFVILLVIAAIYWRQRGISQQQEELVVPETLSVEEQLEDKFKVEIPEDVDKAELKDAGGGTGSGIATKKFEDGKFSHSVLADLPDPSVGGFYAAWLIKGDEGSDDFSRILTGRLVSAKGGWKLDYTTGVDYSDHGKVVVSEEKTSDTTPEKVVLEGSF